MTDHLEPFRLVQVHRWSAPLFAKLTFPRFGHRLQMAGTDRSVMAVGAVSGDHAAGLVLGEHQLVGGVSEVLSLYVAPSYRGRGIGTALLKELEAVSTARGCQRMELVYVEKPPATHALERLLLRLDWQPPQVRMVLCKVDRRVLQASWFTKPNLPPEFEIFPWCDLRLDERVEIERSQRERSWYPETLSPFQDEDTQEPVTSLGLRYQGAVAGWLITHRLDARTVRYTTLFVREDLRGQHCWLALLHEALQRQAQALGLQSLGSFGVHAQNASMLRLLDAYLAPYLAERRESRGTFKVLRHQG